MELVYQDRLSIKLGQANICERNEFFWGGKKEGHKMIETKQISLESCTISSRMNSFFGFLKVVYEW